MSAIDAARKAIDTIKGTGSSSVQGNALSSLISGVEDFVKIVQAEAELAKELPKMEKELREKQRFLNEPDLERDEEQTLHHEVANLSGTIQEAENARRKVDANRSTLRILEKDVDRLRDAIKKAL